MSLFGKLLGLGSFEQYKQEADRLFAAGEYGQAKLQYEEARARAEQAAPAQAAEVEARINECLDLMAKARIRKALELLRGKDRELAMAELAGAAEIAASPEIAGEARRHMEEAEREDAREMAAEPEPLSEEDRFAAIAGSWEEEQSEEYERYGEPLRKALLALYDERIEEARQALEDLLGRARDPRYLYFEVGRARLLAGDNEGGAQALKSFLAGIGPDEGGDTRLTAHLELARLAKEGGDLDSAIGQLQGAVEALPRDPRPYLVMGNFLRKEGLAEEAAEVLESGIRAVDQTHPDWRTVQELGLAYADLGQDKKAISTLEQAVEQLISRQHFDLTPEAATRLAELQEKAGNKGRAADLYVLLARGSDRANHFIYHVEAGRLLAELGIKDEARRMLQRAKELAPDDEQARATLKKRLEALDGSEPGT